MASFLHDNLITLKIISEENNDLSEEFRLYLLISYWQHRFDYFSRVGILTKTRNWKGSLGLQYSCLYNSKHQQTKHNGWLESGGRDILMPGLWTITALHTK